MRLFGNATNRIMETSPGAAIEVGTLATILRYSDREPARVAEILATDRDGSPIAVRLEHLRWAPSGRFDGYGVVSSPPESSGGSDIAKRSGASGQWRIGSKRQGDGVVFGHAEAYRDPHF